MHTALCEDNASSINFCAKKCNSAEKCAKKRKCIRKCPKTCDACQISTSVSPPTFPPSPSPFTCPPTATFPEPPEDGWTVIQRRGDFGRPADYFLRNWTDYKNGFGDPEEDFWLGLENIHRLGLGRRQDLLIELEDFEGAKVEVIISNFQVGDESTAYTVTHSGYKDKIDGRLGRSFPPSGTKFSTIDRDNDSYHGNCAQAKSGAWWYTACYQSNLNGLYLRGPHCSYGTGMEWREWRGYYYSLKSTVMKVRATT